MPKDYSDVSGIMQGAQMAMQAYGIKNERDMQKYNQQMQDRQMLLREKQDVREMNAAELASKITNLKYEQEKAETERYNRNKDMMVTEDAIKRAQLEATQKAMIRNKTSADTFRKSGGLPGTEFDYLNESYAMAQEAGDYKTMADLASNLLNTAGVFTPKGFDASGRPVGTDKSGNLVYGDTKEPYIGGQFKSLTEPAMNAQMSGVPTFEDMSPADKEFWYQSYAADRSAKPDFYYRDPKSKNAFMKGFAEYQRSLGLTGVETVAGRANVKSLQSSLNKQQVSYGAMRSFVKNIDGQLGKVESRMTDIINRVGVKALDVPWRELVVRFKGSGQENVLAAYLKEISNEINKLSQGSQASIAVLPEGSRKEWDKIHDPNLSLSELKIVLEGTREMANIRMKSVEDAMAFTKEQLSTAVPTSNVELSKPIEYNFDSNGNLIK